MRSGASAATGAEGAGPPPPEAWTVDDDAAWLLLLAIRARADRGQLGEAASWGFRRAAPGWQPADDAVADVVVDQAAAKLTYCRWPLSDSAGQLFSLLLGLALRAREAGHVMALLGQSLDGFIATRHGDSRHLNGAESLAHLHRLRALSDAVLIGVGTAVADRPRLTTRHVPGPHATRVVVDPRGRLEADCGLLGDGAAPTIVVRATEGQAFARRLTDQATALYLPAAQARIEPAALLAALAERGITRLLIEGGGVTVGRFLEAGVLDRLQLAVSPLIIGAGRPALPVRPVDRLEQAMRPACARHLLGQDVLFDLRFDRSAPAADPGRQSC